MSNGSGERRERSCCCFLEWQVFYTFWVSLQTGLMEVSESEGFPSPSPSLSPRRLLLLSHIVQPVCDYCAMREFHCCADRVEQTRQEDYCIWCDICKTRVYCHFHGTACIVPQCTRITNNNDDTGHIRFRVKRGFQLMLVVSKKTGRITGRKSLLFFP